MVLPLKIISHEFSEYVPYMRDMFTCSEIVFIAMVSILCGAETWSEMEMFGKSHIDYFKRWLQWLSCY